MFSFIWNECSRAQLLCWVICSCMFTFIRIAKLFSRVAILFIPPRSCPHLSLLRCSCVGCCFSHSEWYVAVLSSWFLICKSLMANDVGLVFLLAMHFTSVKCLSPSVARLGVRRGQAWVAYFCWVVGQLADTLLLYRFSSPGSLMSSSSFHLLNLSFVGLLHCFQGL